MGVSRLESCLGLYVDDKLEYTHIAFNLLVTRMQFIVEKQLQNPIIILDIQLKCTENWEIENILTLLKKSGK